MTTRSVTHDTFVRAPPSSTLMGFTRWAPIIFPWKSDTLAPGEGCHRAMVHYIVGCQAVADRRPATLFKRGARMTVSGASSWSV